MRHHETRLAFNNQGENNAKRGTTFCKNTKSASSKSMAYQPKSNFTVQVGLEWWPPLVALDVARDRPGMIARDDDSGASNVQKNPSDSRHAGLPSGDRVLHPAAWLQVGLSRQRRCTELCRILPRRGRAPHAVSVRARNGQHSPAV